MNRMNEYCREYALVYLDKLDASPLAAEAYMARTLARIPPAWIEPLREQIRDYQRVTE